MFVTPSWKLISRLSLIVLLAGLTACSGLGWFQADEPKPEPLDPDRLFNLQIDIGRLDVMQDRAWEATQLIAGQTGQEIRYAIADEPCADCEDENLTSSLQAVLRRVAVNYQVFRTQACGLEFEDNGACANEFSAPWNEQMAAEDPTLEELEEWYNVTIESLSPLWGEVCVQAIAISGNDLFCSVE